MITFTVLGFIAKGGQYTNFNLDIFAESPVDAVEKVMKQHSNLVVSGVCRSSAGRFMDY